MAVFWRWSSCEGLVVFAGFLNGVLLFAHVWTLTRPPKQEEEQCHHRESGDDHRGRNSPGFLWEFWQQSCCVRTQFLGELVSTLNFTVWSLHATRNAWDYCRRSFKIASLFSKYLLANQTCKSCRIGPNLCQEAWIFHAVAIIKAWWIGGSRCRRFWLPSLSFFYQFCCLFQARTQRKKDFRLLRTVVNIPLSPLFFNSWWILRSRDLRVFGASRIHGLSTPCVTRDDCTFQFPFKMYTESLLEGAWSSLTSAVIWLGTSDEVFEVSSP